MKYDYTYPTTGKHDIMSVTDDINKFDMTKFYECVVWHAYYSNDTSYSYMNVKLPYDRQSRDKRTKYFDRKGRWVGELLKRTGYSENSDPPPLPDEYKVTPYVLIADSLKLTALVLGILSFVFFSYILILLSVVIGLGSMIFLNYRNIHKRYERRVDEIFTEIKQRRDELVKEYEDYTGKPLRRNVSCGEIKYIIKETLTEDLYGEYK